MEWAKYWNYGCILEQVVAFVHGHHCSVMCKVHSL